MDWENRTVSLLLCLSILLATIHDGNAERKIVCYYTNWSIYRPGTAKFSPQNINPYLCTHLIYAFGGFTKDNTLKPFDKYQDIEKGGYAKFTGLKTYNKNLKTLLAIGGWNEGSSRFSPMVADPDRRREFVKNAIKFLRKNHFDGLDLDWEYPAFRDGGKPRDKDNYASLVQELREEFERESSKTGRPRLLLTLAMPAGIEYIDKGYDIPRLNEYLDFINLLSYDYHSSYEPAVNHHSPLYPLEEDNEYNYDSELTIDYTINYLLKKGASSEKIILGIPTYGRSYTLYNQDATDLGSPADGPGVEGDATREKGYLAYYEICESLAKSDEWEVIQPNPDAMGPYAYKDDQWVGYDDENIVRLKAKYANEKNLGGIMFWTIDNDDFRGKCHDRPYPLIEAAKETLLAESTNTVQKAKTADSRKKPRTQGAQSNAIGRKVIGSSSRRSTTTAAPVTKKRVFSSRPKHRTLSRPRVNDEEEEEEREVGRRSYDASDEEENSEGGNAVRTADKNERPSSKNRNRPKGRLNTRNRRKPARRKDEKNDSGEESLSNKLTTPEPPTTPDPGTDFKCEDEGFFSHPRDCKKYFWCLDSGPGGLGVVAHQFTCPSGLVFNKAADSCDYPRNVVCPKPKTAQTTASTTRAPITAATSRTTYLYSTTRRPTTEKPDSEEEYEYYDEDDEEIEEEEKEEKKEPRVTTTPKTLLYKTITRNRATSTTTTTEAPSTTSKTEKVLDLEDEEDPRVIKELIKLIKKAGGLEELEKQLLLQDKNSEDTVNSNNESATPATISRTLYERVLNRQASKTTNKQRASTTNTNYANGPGKSQFEGLDEVPEVKTLRRSQKPQYVTIERPKPSTKEPPVEEEEADEDEELDDDNTDVASSEEQKISNPFLTSSTQRATPNYVNIRRSRPSTSRTENDVEEKRKNVEEETPTRRHRPDTSSKNTETNSAEDIRDPESRPSTSKGTSQTTKFRYVSVQRFRSTTPQSTEETTSEAPSSSQEPTTESVVSSEAPSVTQNANATTTTPSINVVTSIVLSSTPNDILVQSETEKSVSTATPEPSSITTESVRLVEDSATEILLTTAPASLSTLSVPNTRISTASVSQPRPFGFNRRNRPTIEPTTTPLPAANDQTRSKVASADVNRLPTLKELIGYRTNDFVTSSPSPIFLSLFPLEGKEEEVLDRAAIRENVILNDTETKHSTLNKYDRKELDLSADSNSYYVEDNIANDEDESSLTNKKRFDREDSLTTTIRPTTMRGTPLVDLLHSQAPRGFYVTRSETKPATSEKVGSETIEATTENNEDAVSAITDRTEQLITNAKSVTDLEQTATNQNSQSSVEVSTVSNSQRTRGRVTSTVSSINQETAQTEKSTFVTSEISSFVSSTENSGLEEIVTRSTSTPETSSINSTIIRFNSPVTAASGTSSISESIDFTTENVANAYTTLSIGSTDSTLNSQTEVQSNSMTTASSIEPTTEAYVENETIKIDLVNTYSTEKNIYTTQTEQDEKNSTNGDEELKSTTLLSVTTLNPTTADLTETPIIRGRTSNKYNRRRQEIGNNSAYEFGRKSQRRGQTRQTTKPVNEDQESIKNPDRTQQPRRRIITYRRRHRKPNASTTAAINGSTNNRSKPEIRKKPVQRKFEQIETTTTFAKETEKNNSVLNPNDREGLNGEEINEGEELIPKANQTRNVAASNEEPEVNSSKNTVTTRTPGNLSSTRLRKPTTLTLTPQHSKPSNTLANHRNTRPKDGNLTHVNEKLDAADEITEVQKSEKDIDQSSKAQEIAVTLADPPSSQTPATGRPPLRNVLRRKISTTVAPRTDATTSRTTLRFTAAPRNRQSSKAKDKSPQNATTRPRRPPVVDYDYYEDEEEPVVGKSTFNGKLFLTSTGTFRCLDQGNFPHPFSCKKFITCARMVNGLVVGAEYTCPDKLSFDPVGGICNWSAGLGCKE